MHSLIASLLTFICCIALSTGKPDGLVERVSGALPEKLRPLLAGRTTRASVEKAFGKPARVEKGELLYALDDFRYSLTIRLKGDMVSGFVYRVPDGRLALADLDPWLKDRKPEYPAKDPHDLGRYLSYRYPSSGLTLIFVNDGPKTLQFIEAQVKP